MAIINLEMSPNCVDVRFNLPLCTNVIFKTITITNLKNEKNIIIRGFPRKPIYGYVRETFGPKPQIKQTKCYHVKTYFYEMDFLKNVYPNLKMLGFWQGALSF